MNIEALAKKAGFTVANGSYGLRFSGGDLELFARFIAEEEREACATACEGQTEGFAATSTWDEAALSCARTIRMRSNVKVSTLPHAQEADETNSAASCGRCARP